MPTGKKVLVGGHALYSYLDADNQYAGVAILLNAKHVKKNNNVHMISGRVIVVEFVIYGKAFCGISVYAPHRGYSAEHLEQTYNQLRCIASKARRSNK